MTMVFNTLQAARELREAGFEEPQADALATVFGRSLSQELVTKPALQAELQTLEQRLTIEFGAMVAGAVAIMLAALSIVTAILLAAG